MSTFKNKNSLRTIEAQFVQNLRTMRLSQNLLVLIKKKCVNFFLIKKNCGNKQTIKKQVEDRMLTLLQQFFQTHLNYTELNYLLKHLMFLKLE